MYRVLQVPRLGLARVLRCVAAVIGAALLVTGCSGNFSVKDLLSSSPASTAAQPTTNIGTGQVKAGLILPLSATGNAALAAKSMRTAAEMAFAEFNSPDVQLIVKDDGGTAAGAQQVAQQALDEGSEIILGPLFGVHQRAGGG